MNDETMREVFEKWARKETDFDLSRVASGEYLFTAASDAWTGWQAAWNTHAQASAPEDVESLINTCVGWVSAVACNGSLAYAAQDDIKREITKLFTLSNAKAGEVDRLVNTRGYKAARHAIECLRATAEFRDEEGEDTDAIEAFLDALSTHDKTKAGEQPCDD